jgi:hypothetical protein
MLILASGALIKGMPWASFGPRALTNSTYSDKTYCQPTIVSGSSSPPISQKERKLINSFIKQDRKGARALRFVKAASSVFIGHKAVQAVM